MSLLPLVIAPDPRLKTKSAPIEHITDDIRKLAADMFATMYHLKGVGLAAVQVGVLKRMLVADVEWNDELGTAGKQWVLINPEIVEQSKDPHIYKEGCLSFPEQYAEVERPESVRVRFQDLTGERREETFTGLLATCVQHEIDHLNGIVFVDHISPVRRDMIVRRVQKMKKQGYFDHDHANCGHDHSHDHHHHVHGEHCNH